MRRRSQHLPLSAALCLLLTLVFAAGPILAQQPQAAAQAQPAADQEKLFDYREIVLDNGLRVVTLEDFSSPIVACQVWYHVGSKNEMPERQGFAHMFEHMMFKGTDVIGPKEHFALLNRTGADVNGYTSFDRTVYLETVPADQLELALWLEAERMGFLKIDKEAFDTERNVVLEELRMRENQPYGTLFKKVLQSLFKESPYRWMPIGQIAHLRAATLGELRAFWERYYVPNNATLVIVGAVEHEKAQALAKKYFGWMPRWKDVPEVQVWEPEWKQAETIVIDNENAPAPLAMMIWRTVPIGHPDAPKLDLLSEILGGGKSSRIYREIVAEKQLAVDASTSTWNLEDEGLFFADATQPPDAKDPGQLIDIIKRHIQDVKEEGVTEEEFLKAKNQMLKSLVTQNLTIDSKARMIGTAAVEVGDVSYVNKILPRIESITRQDLQDVAKKYLREDAVRIFIVQQNPQGMQGATLDDESAPVAESEAVVVKPGRPGWMRPEFFPSEPPMGDLVTDAPKSQYTRDELENGLTVMVVANHEVPFVSAMLGLRNGAWTEENPGAANMALQMLTRGTAEHTEAELSEILDRYAISLAGSAGMDTSSVSTNCVTEEIGRAVELMAEVVLAPTFPEEEFEKLRKQILTDLAIRSESPEYLVDKQFRRQLYGRHPYARTTVGEPEDVAALTVPMVRQWWEQYARPDQATLIFAGDITREKALELVRKHLADWKQPGPAKEIDLPPIPPMKPTHITIVDKPGAAQSQIRVGQLGFTRRRQPEYFVSRVVNNYFGGSFNSRLNEILRIEKGLTYGAWGAYIAQNFAGQFTVGTFTKTDSVDETVATIFAEIERLMEVAPTDQELDDSKSFIAGNFVLERETPQQIASDLWLIESQDLQADYMKRLLETIAHTTKPECLALVKETLQPGRMVVVVTGDASLLREDLAKIAPVTVVSAAGEPEPMPAAPAARPEEVEGPPDPEPKQARRAAELAAVG